MSKVYAHLGLVFISLFVSSYSSWLILELNQFTDARVHELRKRIRITSFNRHNQARIKGDDTFSYVKPSSFLAGKEVNKVTYEVHSKKDTFAFQEFHLALEEGAILRAIFAIDVPASKKNISVPESWKMTLVGHAHDWITLLDTLPPENRVSAMSEDSTLKKFYKGAYNFFQIAEQSLMADGYQAAYDSLLSLESEYADENNLSEKSIYYQALMTFASFVSQHRKSLHYQAIGIPRRYKDTLPDMSNFRPQDAKRYLINRYADAPVLLLNEAHNSGQHRAFVRSLLPGLYEKGFRFLALEALDHNDSTINGRGYPIQTSGFYVREPAFAQLIREAIALGYQVVPYEDTTSVFDPEQSAIERSNMRDQAQAQHLYNLISRHPDEKVLVLAGHAHIAKGSDENWIKMGQRLVDLLGQDIPSVECTLMREGYEPKNESGYYRAALQMANPERPFVLIDTTNNQPFVHPSYPEKYDLNVFFPRTDETNGYPDWLVTSKDFYYDFTVDQDFLRGKLFQVYNLQEWEQEHQKAIPINQVIIGQHERWKFRFFLPPGSYIGLVSGANHTPIYRKQFRVSN